MKLKISFSSHLSFFNTILCHALKNKPLFHDSIDKNTDQNNHYKDHEDYVDIEYSIYGEKPSWESEEEAKNEIEGKV